MPLTVAELGIVAREMVDAGVAELHVHPKDAEGADTLNPDRVAELVAALRTSGSDSKTSLSTRTGPRWALRAVPTSCAALVRSARDCYRP